MIWIAVVAAEIGWLAVWLLSAGLSHSPAFTQAYLDDLALARTLVDSLRTYAAGPDGPNAAIALAVAFGWLGSVYVASLAFLHGRPEPRRGTVLAVLAGSLVFQATLVSMPGLFSQDVFGYLVYGRIADAYGLNPYVWPPSAIDKDPLVGWVAQVWRTYACPYGPLWVDVQMRVAHLLGDLPPLQQALAYRVLASGVFLASLGVVWRGLGRVVALDRAARLTAFAALAWNPLVLLELVGSAHNDGLMLAASLLAVVPLLGNRQARLGLDHLAAGVCFTLGTLVKYLSGLGLVWVLVAAAARQPSGRARALRVGVVGLASLLVMAAVSAPWLELPDSLDPLLNETAGVGYVNALPDHLALAVAERASLTFGSPEAETREAARAVERVVVLGIFGLVLASESRHVWREPSAETIVRATARSSLIFILVVSSSLQPWYFALPLALAVLLGWRDSLTRAVVGYSVVGLPALYLAYYLREQTPELVYIVYALAPLLLVLPSLPAWRPVAGRLKIAPLVASFSFWGVRPQYLGHRALDHHVDQ